MSKYFLGRWTELANNFWGGEGVSKYFLGGGSKFCKKNMQPGERDGGNGCTNHIEQIVEFNIIKQIFHMIFRINWYLTSMTYPLHNL